jgi:hypothetical protein
LDCLLPEWLSFIFGSYNGDMVVFLTEIMPVKLRASRHRKPGSGIAVVMCGLVASLVAKPQPATAEVL